MSNLILLLRYKCTWIERFFFIFMMNTQWISSLIFPSFTSNWPDAIKKRTISFFCRFPFIENPFVFHCQKQQNNNNRKKKRNYSLLINFYLFNSFNLIASSFSHHRSLPIQMELRASFSLDWPSTRRRSEQTAKRKEKRINGFLWQNNSHQKRNDIEKRFEMMCIISLIFSLKTIKHKNRSRQCFSFGFLFAMMSNHKRKEDDKVNIYFLFYLRSFLVFLYMFDWR